DGVDHVPHHLRAAEVLGLTLELVEAEGAPDAAAVLPRLTLRHLPGLVLGGHEVVVGTGEAVVDQPVGSLAVEVLEQLAEPACPKCRFSSGQPMSFQSTSGP